MATFSESQVTDLCEILETDSDYLADHLEFYANQISEADKTKVLAKITEWETAGAKFTAIEPNVRNFGAKINPDNQKNQIRSQIASLLYAKHLLENFSSSQGVVNPL
jgi:hypothetical protein